MVHLKDNNEQLHGLEFVFIELDKFKAQNITEKKLQVLWLRFMTEVNENTVEIDPELLDEPEIQKALAYVMEVSLSDSEKLLYEKNWDRISSEKTLLTAAMEEGREEGKMQEKIELAKNARKMGLSDEDIVKLTGLKIDDLKKIK